MKKLIAIASLIAFVAAAFLIQQPASSQNSVWKAKPKNNTAVRALVETLDARIRSDSITPGPAAP